MKKMGEDEDEQEEYVPPGGHQPVAKVSGPHEGTRNSPKRAPASRPDVVEASTRAVASNERNEYRTKFLKAMKNKNTPDW